MLIHGVLDFPQLLRDTNQLFNHDLVRAFFSFLFWIFEVINFLDVWGLFGCWKNEGKVIFMEISFFQTYKVWIFNQFALSYIKPSCHFFVFWFSIGLFVAKKWLGNWRLWEFKVLMFKVWIFKEVELGCTKPWSRFFALCLLIDLFCCKKVSLWEFKVLMCEDWIF
jgi:hypothetical protein